MRARTTSSASSSDAPSRRAHESARVLLRFFFAVWLPRLAQGRGARRKTRAHGGLATDAARRGVQDHGREAASRGAGQGRLREARFPALGALLRRAVQPAYALPHLNRGAVPGVLRGE